MTEKKQSKQQQGNQEGKQSSQPDQQAKATKQEQQNAQPANQNISLNSSEQEISQQVDEQIQGFAEQLNNKSNTELKQISQQLEGVERKMLLEKIDNELQTIKEAVVKPGDIASTAAAGSTAATAIQTPPTSAETEATL